MTDLDLCDVCGKPMNRLEHSPPSSNPHIHTWCRIRALLGVAHVMAKAKRDWDK